MAGLPAVAFSRLHVEQHLVPGVQVHVDAGGVAYQAAGQHLQLLVDEPRGLQPGASRAKVGRGAKLDLQQGAHFAIHSLEGEAGCSACSPDPVEGGEKLVKLTSIGVKHCVGNHGSHFWYIF